MNAPPDARPTGVPLSHVIQQMQNSKSERTEDFHTSEPTATQVMVQVTGDCNIQNMNINFNS